MQPLEQDNWIERFDKEFVADGVPKTYPTIAKGNWLHTAIPATVRTFITSEKQKSFEDGLRRAREVLPTGFDTRKLTRSEFADELESFGYVKGFNACREETLKAIDKLK